MSRVLPAPVIRYGDDPDHVANLHLPHTSPEAVIALVHGGFWRSRWDRTLMTPVAIDLARRGFAAWNVEFRRVGQAGGGWPGTLEDVRAALDAVGAQPELTGRRMVVVGHSSGGQLALVAARDRRDVDAVVALGALSDLEQAHHLDAAAVDEFLGGPPGEVSERLHAASPRALAPLGIPQILVHGELDDVVPSGMSVEYARVAQDAGDDVELVLIPDADHFDVIDPDHAAWQETVARIEEAVSTRHPRIRS